MGASATWGTVSSSDTAYGEASANYTDANGNVIGVDPPVAVSDHQYGASDSAANYTDPSGVSAAVDPNGNPIPSPGGDSGFWGDLFSGNFSGAGKNALHPLLGDVPLGTPTGTPGTTNYLNPASQTTYQAASGANHATPPPPPAKGGIPWWGWALLLGVGGVVIFGSAHLINTVKE